MEKIKVTDNLPNLKAKRKVLSQLTEKAILKDKKTKNQLPDTLMTSPSAKWSPAGYSLQPKVW